MSALLVWRLSKLLSLVVFAGGVFGSLTRPDRAGRMRLAHLVATPGFAGVSRLVATPSQEPVDAHAAWRWFVWIARLEGASLLVMLFVSMPLKRAAGFAIDGGTGLVGWTHGVLVLIYLRALSSTGRALGWSGRTMALAFVASMLPFGTFVFERRIEGPERQNAK